MGSAERVPIAVLDIPCSVPSKKNLLRRSGFRKGTRSTPLAYKNGVREKMAEIELHVLRGWQKRRTVFFFPIEHPDVVVDFWVDNFNQDKDGIFTTVLDCMKRVGVIVDDSLKHFNGTVTLNPARQAVQPGGPRIVVTLYEGQGKETFTDERPES